MTTEEQIAFVNENEKYCHNGCMPCVIMICRDDNVWFFEVHCAHGGLLITTVSA